MAETQNHGDVEEVVRAWDAARAAHDPDALVECYAPNAVLESPGAARLLGSTGVCRGRDQLRPLFAEVVARSHDTPDAYRAGFLTDGRRVVWEYPRETPDGEQMDFVEVMEIENGLIQAHRVYWGWKVGEM